VSQSLFDKSRRFWTKFEVTILEIVELALDELEQKASLPRQEDELNREFYFCLVNANYNLQLVGRGLSYPPSYEARNQPSSDHQTRSAREFKRPDFQWPITDINEDDPLKSSKFFILECKRLDQQKNSWDYLDNYVHYGVNRFVDNVHSYGYDVESSAMLGYLQFFDFPSVEAAINKKLRGMSQAKLNVLKSSNSRRTLNHDLATTHSLKKIKLIHLWTDIKFFYQG